MIGSRKRSAEIADDSCRDGQAQTQAVAGILGREEGLEQALLRFLAQARTMVAYQQANCLMMHVAADFDGWGILSGLGVEGVADQVDHHLFEPVGVAESFDRRCGEVLNDLSPGAFQALVEQGNCIADN